MWLQDEGGIKEETQEINGQIIESDPKVDTTMKSMSRGGKQDGARERLCVSEGEKQ